MGFSYQAFVYIKKINKLKNTDTVICLASLI